MKQLFIVLLISHMASLALACSFDSDCGVGAACVKAAQSWNNDGMCVHQANNFNNPYANDASFGPHKTSGCQSQFDCDFGASCIKQNNELYGICAK